MNYRVLIRVLPQKILSALPKRDYEAVRDAIFNLATIHARAAAKS